MSKKYEVSATWSMAGTYHIQDDSLYDAVERVKKAYPLPEEQEYISDSFVVGDMMELMALNGWDADLLEALSNVSKDDLLKLVEGHKNTDLLTVNDETEVSAGTIRDYLTDLYGSNKPVSPAVAQIMAQPDLLVKAEQVLVDNGIEADEAQTVLQALGYVLLNQELYPEG